MKGKQLLIAVIALGVLGALAFFTSERNQGSQSSDQSGIGSEVVTKLDPSKVKTVVITDKDGTVTLRDRDTTEQKRVTEEELLAFLDEQLF